MSKTIYQQTIALLEAANITQSYEQQCLYFEGVERMVRTAGIG